MEPKHHIALIVVAIALFSASVSVWQITGGDPKGLAASLVPAWSVELKATTQVKPHTPASVDSLSTRVSSDETSDSQLLPLR